ncbi:hypothetical protein J4470_02615 [Candidatus Woesearchaeota archaeon]|nr:hypothetical protein [Candidatus Woesearchaeota archaeon]
MAGTIDTFVAELEHHRQSYNIGIAIPEGLSAEKAFGAFCAAYVTFFNLKEPNEGQELKQQYVIHGEPQPELRVLEQLKIIGITEIGNNQYRVNITSQGIDFVMRDKIPIEELIRRANAYAEQI